MTTRTFPLAGPITLEVRLGGGSVAINARDGVREASVTTTARGKSAAADRIETKLDGNTFSVGGPRQRGLQEFLASWLRDRDCVDVAITVPSATPMHIATFTADITVVGRAGNVDISTGAAAIELDEIDGDLRLRYGSATTHVRAVHGATVLRSGAGTIRIDEIWGPLQSHSGSGELDVESARGPVHVRTGAGGTRLGRVCADVDVAAGSGDLTVGLPAGTSAKLDVKTGAGRFTSDLPVDKGRTGRGPAIAIRARTGSGDIRLLHLGETPNLTKRPA